MNMNDGGRGSAIWASKQTAEARAGGPWKSTEAWPICMAQVTGQIDFASSQGASEVLFYTYFDRNDLVATAQIQAGLESLGYVANSAGFNRGGGVWGLSFRISWPAKK